MSDSKTLHAELIEQVGAQIAVVGDHAAHLATLLRGKGHRVSTHSCLDAAEKLSLDPPRLLVISADLEDGSGLEFVADLRNEYSPERLAIIVLAAADEATILRCFAAGATDCITLPVSDTSLLVKCGEFLKRKRRRKPPSLKSHDGEVLFERYQICGLLGEGAYGVVYDALDTERQERVALKVLHEPVEEEAKRRFLREVYVSACFRGDELVEVFDSGSADGRLYYAMEAVRGPTLQDHVEACGPTTDAETRALLAGLARGLQHLERGGMIHRDIKPANIVLRDGDVGRPVLIDFGLAKKTIDRALTNEGMIHGTPGYMAPELLERSDVDIRSDLFSLGVVGIFACEGSEAFPSEAGFRLLRTMSEVRVPIPRHISTDLRWLLSDLTAIDPQLRPHNASEVLAQIEAMDPSQGSESPSPSRSSTV